MSRPRGAEYGRLAPSAPLGAFVEHYWWVRWDLAEPESSEVLSYPSVHAVLEGRNGRLIGIVKRKFSRRLEGRGAVFGVKFRPGMFRQFAGGPVARLTNRTLPLGSELGRPARELAREAFALGTELERARLVEESLLRVLPEPDPGAVRARGLVERIRGDASLRSVAALARFSGLGVRALERLFREYVGVGPKWVVQRFRLQEAAELLRCEGTSVAALAAELGYFDQAHFARDFRAIVGVSPSAYAARARSRAP